MALPPRVIEAVRDDGKVLYAIACDPACVAQIPNLAEQGVVGPYQWRDRDTGEILNPLPMADHSASSSLLSFPAAR